MTLQSIDPASGKKMRAYGELSSDDIPGRIDKTYAAQNQWRRTGIRQQAAMMEKLSGILRSKAGEYSRLMALEMGKPVRDGNREIEKCAWLCRHYAATAESMLESEGVQTDATRSFVTFQPLGVILAVMPWNYPFWQVFRLAVPALMAGNGVLLKHASNVPGCAEAIADAFDRAGFPEAIFQHLPVSSGKVEAIVAHPRVAAVSLTGSTEAGRSVAGQAGRHLKKTVLELGGSDPYLILEDADLEVAVEACATSRLLNSGQSCIAAKRFIVVDAVREPFEAKLVQALREKVMGDPLDENTDIGPQARPDLRDKLHDQVTASIQQGARCLLGGVVPDGPGYFYPPTVLTDVGKGMPVFDEETFGPVAAVVPVPDEKTAIDVANDSDYGLGAAVFTRDSARGERLAVSEIQAGNCFVNTFVKSDPRLPFGGIRNSGYGRELSHFGLREFVNVKTVWVQ
ncbi:MAG: NAD-dependent succinate-semialdehyde dehydrogenase [Deltaproteobacteria bacterium]|jgi:succinate-semialdehyde dehydrogenase/glutarate-semialdehyde dehydrogenase|nr:NAD-dependent succinate-semialdehyde dehydrogenase [Deltaproteobacteria bacterium]